MNTNEEDLFLNIRSSEMALLFDYIPDVQFWIKDTKSIFQWVNKAFLENYALSELSGVVGKTDFDLSPFYIAEQFVKDDAEVLM